MRQEFEYISYNEADRIATLENRAAELERRLLEFVSPDAVHGWPNVATPAGGGQHELAALPGADDPDLGAARVRGNQGRIRGVACLVEVDAEKAEAVTYPFPDERRVLADPGGEDECIEATERRGEGADPLLHLIAEQGDGLGGPNIGSFACEQIAQIGAAPGHAGDPAARSGRADAGRPRRPGVPGRPGWPDPGSRYPLAPAVAAAGSTP